MATSPEMLIHARDSPFEEDARMTLFLLLYYPCNFYLGILSFFTLLALLVLKIYECSKRIEAQKAIEKLEEKKERAVGDEEPCAICFCEYERGEEIYRPGCGHFFHKECLWKWLEENASCPMCRNREM